MNWVRFENGDSNIEITVKRRKSSELGIEEGFSEVYLNDVSVVQKNQVTGTNKVVNAIDVNIYNSEIYYAVIENGQLVFFNSKEYRIVSF